MVINNKLIHPRITLDAEAKCSEITLRGGGPVRIVKTDSDVKLFPLISIVEGHHSVADYCIFTENTIIICDLKSGKSEKAKHQIINTRLIVDYLINFMRYHYKLSDKLIPSIEYAVFSGIVSKGLSKPTKLNKKNSHGFEYFELGCGGTYKIKDLC